MPSTLTQSLADRVREIATNAPDRAAIIEVTADRSGRLHKTAHRYRDISIRAEALAHGLQEIGVAAGTRVSFMIPPGVDAVIAGIALWRIGATFVGIEPHSHGLSNVSKSLNPVKPEVFIGTPEAHVGRRVFGWGKGSIKTDIVVGRFAPPGMHATRKLESKHLGKAPLEVEVDPDAPGVIAFTTGSTGAPKPTVLTHSNFSALSQLIIDQWGFAGRDDIVDMPTFPMFWIIGLNAGGTVVIPPMDFTRKGPGDADPALLLKTIKECNVGTMFASPSLLTRLSQHAKETGESTNLRRIVAGGAEIQGPLYDAVKTFVCPNGELYSNYGATEALPLAEISGDQVLSNTWPETLRGHGLCVGAALAGVEVKIVEISDEPIASIDAATELPVGKIGEVIARSPHFSTGYYNRPQADIENKIPDPTGRWHRLGDTGFLDENNDLWVCGRVSHRVQTATATYFPLQCEPIVNDVEGVHRSALIALKSQDGTVTAAMCVERGETNMSDSELSDSVRTALDKYDATRGITEVRVIDQLPVDKRHNAKIDRPELGRQFSEGL